MELCLYDLVRHLPARTTTRIFAAAVENPLPGVDFVGIRVNRPGRVDYAQLLQAVAAFNPDLIWVQTDFATAARLKLSFRRLPVLVHRHRVEPEEWPKTAWRRLAFAPFIDRLIYVSRTASSSSPYTNVARDVVANGLDMTTLSTGRHHEQRERVIAYAGRLAASKGVLVMADGLAQFLSDRADWRACLLLRRDGEADTQRTFLRILEPIAQSVEVRFDVPHSDVLELLGLASIAVAPSLAAEGFGRFPLEAMAKGCPIIHSDVAAFREVIGDSGICIPSPVTAPEIHASLLRLSDDERLRARLSKAATARARQEFDIRRSASKLQAVFEQSLLHSKD